RESSIAWTGRGTTGCVTACERPDYRYDPPPQPTAVDCIRCDPADCFGFGPGPGTEASSHRSVAADQEDHTRDDGRPGESCHRQGKRDVAIVGIRKTDEGKRGRVAFPGQVRDFRSLRRRFARGSVGRTLHGRLEPMATSDLACAVA